MKPAADSSLPWPCGAVSAGAAGESSVQWEQGLWAAPTFLCSEVAQAPWETGEMMLQRLWQSSPNTDVLEWEALGQGKTERCLVFPARAEQTSHFKAPVESRDGPGAWMGVSVTLLRSGLGS